MSSTSRYLKVSHRTNHLRCFIHQNAKANVLMIHGSIEDGRIFYSLNNKGLAPFFQQNFINSFVIDLGGRGLSTPTVQKSSSYGHHDAICEDIPSAVDFIQSKYPELPLFLVAHSWGGVLALCYTIRFKPEMLKGIICFGSKRRITVQHFEKWLAVDLIWKAWGSQQAKRHGYFPAKKWKIGSQDEPGLLFNEINEWIHPKSEWVDKSGYNYVDHAIGMKTPKVLHLAGIKDRYLGHPIDVKLFAEESSIPYDFRLLAKSNGYSKDYGHIDMLTSPSAPLDHFSECVEWMLNQLKE